MASVTLTCKQEELINNAAQKCGFKNFEITANEGTAKGDNYLGVITTIKIQEKDEEKVFNLILKSAPTNENFRREVPLAKAFNREAFIYNTIFPRIFELQNEKGISDPFTGAAKYYGCCLEDVDESILMENLKENGYKLWDRKTPMNDEHVTLVFSEYARFHAASYAFKNLYPEEFNELTKDIQKNIFENETTTAEDLKKFSDMYFNTGFSGVEGNAKATAALERMQKNIPSFFTAEVNKNEEAITHGDCWCNNLLFHYEENGTTPNKVCLIDWQLSKLGSPVFDLSYFFCVCSSKEVLLQLTKYLKIYHEILSENLREFGCDPEKVFSFETLMEHWKKYSWYGVFLGMMILKMMLSDSEEVPDISKTVDTGKDLLDAFEFTTSRSSEYKARLCDLVEFMSDNNYI